jgi:glycosyltransferase involved in cell wall biosynthesis
VTQPGIAPTAPARPPVRLPGSLSLVLPAHNEEQNIGIVVEQALEALPRFVDEFEVIVVNDGSRDETPRIADDFARADPRVKVVHHPVNRGYGTALTSGFKAATGDFIMFMDSDRQFDINDLARLTPFAEDFDIVAGFRMERNDPLVRRINAEVFNVAVRILFGVHLRDIDCAFKLFRGDLLRSMEMTAPGALINTEIQAKARRQGARLEQVGVHHYPRVAGTATGGSWRVIARAMRETLFLWWRMHRYEPPTTAKAPNGPYLLGDAAVIGGVLTGLAVTGAVVRRLLRLGRR